MFIDSRLEFADAQALTASAASTNVVDLGSDRDVGPGTPMWVTISVDTAADATTGDETYQFDLQTASDEAFSSPTSIASSTIAAADLSEGSIHVLTVPRTNQRYLRLYSTLAGTTPSVTISAWLGDQEPSSWSAYPDAL